MRILVVDDDVQLRRALRINLEARDHSVIEVGDGNDAVDSMVADKPDFVILDLGLPGLSGADVVNAIRGVSATVPILVLSGRTQSADKVEALDAGANDYVTKPFSIDELLARVRALTRAVTAQSHEVVEFGGVRVDMTRHEITRRTDAGEVPVKLTPTEWGVLEVLLRNPDRLVSKKEILTTVWGNAYGTEDAYLRLFMGQLRKKLEADHSRPKHLLTEPGLGYRFSV
jgi:two-component system KDP operon response regulator KdpE